MLLIKNAQVYSPEYIGKKDILVGGEMILLIKETIDIPQDIEYELINADGMLVVPGLIDAHIHIAGAGGEGGPSTRTPEMPLSQMLKAGVTTVVGCLGTDGFTRSVESVLMKAKSLRAEGVSAWIYTGSYQIPTPTITGDVGKDIALIEEVIGVGEIAISDHRSSFPTTEELIRLTEHARVGGMLGGKAGIVNIHMGDALNPFQPIHNCVEKSELKYTQFLPTHCNRNNYIFEDAKIYGKQGYVDITTSSYPYFPQYEIKPSKALKLLLEAGVPIEHITFTSDACGSLPDFDENGNLRSLKMGLPSSNLRELADAVKIENIPLEVAVKVLTSNVADILKFKNKGRIEEGRDADILILSLDFQITNLIARGQMMIKDGELLKKGAYE